MPTLNSTGNTRSGLPSLISSGKVWKTGRGSGTSTMKWSLGGGGANNCKSRRRSRLERNKNCCAIRYVRRVSASGGRARHLRLPRRAAALENESIQNHSDQWRLEGKNIPHRRPHTSGCRPPSSSVLASVIWNATLCRSEMPTSMSSSMPTSSPEGHVTATL